MLHLFKVPVLNLLFSFFFQERYVVLILGPTSVWWLVPRGYAEFVFKAVVSSWYNASLIFYNQKQNKPPQRHDVQNLCRRWKAKEKDITPNLPFFFFFFKWSHNHINVMYSSVWYEIELATSTLTFCFFYPHKKKLWMDFRVFL